MSRIYSFNFQIKKFLPAFNQFKPVLGKDGQTWCQTQRKFIHIKIAYKSISCCCFTTTVRYHTGNDKHFNNYSRSDPNIARYFLQQLSIVDIVFKGNIRSHAPVSQGYITSFGQQGGYFFFDFTTDRLLVTP